MSKKNSVWSGLCLLVLMALVGTGIAQAQNVGAISGKVTDTSGAVIPGATVELRNLDTGSSRTVTSDGQGNYRAPEVPLGSYQLDASFTGFQKVQRTGVQITLGRDATIDFQLSVGEVQEVVTVTGDAPMVETTKADMGSLVTREQISDLPLRSRDFSQLITMQAGAVQYRHTTGSDIAGYGARISVSGARTSSNSFTLDGVDINTPNQMIPSGVDGAMLGVEAIREFKVLGSNYSAQYGRAAGANLQAVSRSGTNLLHGSLFEYLRNDNLDAAKWETSAFKLKKPEFKRNQFGGSVGGPIIMDKTHFFTTYEGVRQVFPRSEVSVVPSTIARQGANVSPVIRPYLNLWPTPNLTEPATGLVADWANNDIQKINADYVSGRIDHQLHANHSIFGRYTIDDSGLTDPDTIPLFGADARIRNQYITLEERSIISPTTINAVRLGFSRSAQFSDIYEINAPPAALSFVQGRPFGGISTGSGVTGLTGYSGNGPRNYILNIFQVYDDFTWERSSHSIKLGFTYEHFVFNRKGLSRAGGAWTFGNLTSFLTNGTPTRLRIMGPEQFVDAQGRTLRTDPYRTALQDLLSGYFQDDWRVRTNLTLNLGVRWEMTTAGKEKHGRLANLRNALDPFPTVGDPLYDNPTADNFMPRIGFAWDPTGSGKTSLRGGTGLFYEPILARQYLNSIDRQPPFWVDVDVRTADIARVNAFPNLTPVLAQLATGPQALHVTDFNLNSPYIFQWNLAVQHMMTRTSVVELGYTGSRGVHLSSRQDLAVPVPVRQADGRLFYNPSRSAISDLLNPNFSRMEWYSTGANSKYHGLRASFQQRMSNDLNFQANYTFSKAMDNSSTTISGEVGDSTIQNAYDMMADYSLADFYVKHNFVTNFTYQLPIGQGKKIAGGIGSLSNAFIGGWQIAGVFSAITGTPMSATSNNQLSHTLFGGGVRPDLKSGGDNNPVYESPEVRAVPGLFYYDPTNFAPQSGGRAGAPSGYYGNLGRNTIIGPGTTTVDFSLMKNAAITEGKNLQFRAEFFNMLNRPNFSQPSALIFDSAAAFVAEAGRISSTVGSARQIQLALRFTF
ncbi:MAG: hypothetical protein EXQ56_01290 [Acidobacteria bacterium]|nr:hypothetical protein [Acidobacteriota bacterium]